MCIAVIIIMLYVCVSSVENRQCRHIHLWDRKPPGSPWPGLHEATRRVYEARGSAGTVGSWLALEARTVFSVYVLQWVIDSGATSDWNTGSAPDARGLACLRKHGIETDHRAQQVLQMWDFVCYRMSARSFQHSTI